MIRRSILTLLFGLAACTPASLAPGEPTTGTTQSETLDSADVPAGARRVELWATHYYLLEVDPAPGVPLRDMSERVVGPELSARDWCLAAIEGSVRVGGTTFNFAGTRDPSQAACAHAASGRVRWRESRHPFGEGSASNPLIPFRTLACDLGTVAASSAWVDGGFPRQGQRILIPAARGVRLPDGSVHDGIFTCGDVGGKITGNHVDVFIGAVRGGEAGAARVDPFTFVRSTPSATFEAFLLP